MPGPIAKMRQWKMMVNGVLKNIGVFSTDSPDPISTVSGVYNGEYDHGLAYSAGAVVRVTKNQAYGIVTPALATYAAADNVPANGSGNQVPQWPYPPGKVYWYVIAFGPKLSGMCQNGTKQVWVNASAPI